MSVRKTIRRKITGYVIIGQSSTYPDGWIDRFAETRNEAVRMKNQLQVNEYIIKFTIKKASVYADWVKPMRVHK